MKFKEFLTESNASKWKKSIETNKDWKAIVKYLKSIKADFEAPGISDLGSALSLYPRISGETYEIYAYYDDDVEGVYPEDYNDEKDLTFLLMLDGEELSNSDSSKDLIKILKKHL